MHPGHDMVTIRRYGDRYKLVRYKHGSEGGGRAPAAPARPEEGGRYDSSLSRTRARLYELIACNDWEWFGTFTLDPSRWDASDLCAWRTSFSRWLRNCRRSGGAYRYCFVPERHKSGAWHMHGVLGGVPTGVLRQMQADEYLPYDLLGRIRRGEQVMDWPGYRQRYGWCTLLPLRSREACAAYVTKYVTKGMQAASIAAGGHLLHASQGLQHAETVCQGYLIQQPDAWDYDGDWVSIKWLGKDDFEAVYVGDTVRAVGCEVRLR